MARRRQYYDPLQRLNESTWLVVRDQYGSALGRRELAAGTDLRAVLTADRDRTLADGWDCTDICKSCSGFFAQKGHARAHICIERFDPFGDPPRLHSDPAY